MTLVTVGLPSTAGATDVLLRLRSRCVNLETGKMADLLQQLWARDEGQDIAEYAVMLAVILAIALGTIRLIGSNANAVFSQVSSAIQ